MKVGGRIVSILDTSKLLQESKDVYLTLDDGIGINEIVLPVEAYRHYQKKEAFTLNDVIVAEGRILKVDISKEGKHFKHPEEAVRIASWSVSKLATLSKEGEA